MTLNCDDVPACVGPYVRVASLPLTVIMLSASLEGCAPWHGCPRIVAGNSARLSVLGVAGGRARGALDVTGQVFGVAG